MEMGAVAKRVLDVVRVLLDGLESVWVAAEGAEGISKGWSCWIMRLVMQMSTEWDGQGSDVQEYLLVIWGAWPVCAYRSLGANREVEEGLIFCATVIRVVHPMSDCVYLIFFSFFPDQQFPGVTIRFQGATVCGGVLVSVYVCRAM